MVKYLQVDGFNQKSMLFEIGKKWWKCIFFCMLFILSVFSSLWAQSIFIKSKDYFSDCEEGPFKSLVIDINGDAKNDLILLYRLHPLDIVTFSAVRVFVNIGKGEFQQEGRYELEWAVKDISSGDFNSDGYQDFVIGGGDSLYLFLNKGDNSFSIQKSVVQPRAKALSCVDMDNDKDVDLVIAHFNQDTTLSILFNDGDGHFTQTHRYKTNLTPYEEYPIDLVTDDLDYDGDLDIVVLNWVNDAPGSVTVLLNNGDGTLREKGKFSLSGSGEPQSLVATDLNNDNYKDLVVANAYPGGISILLGDSLQTFSRAINYPNISGYTDITVGDFDKEGDMDLAAVSDSLRIFRNTTNSIMELAEVHDARFRYGVKGERLSVSVSDIDNDGDIDLITTSLGSCLFSVFLNLTYSLSVGSDRFTSIIEFGLDQNYPNPFNLWTSIEFRIANLSKVKLTVYDVLGKEVIRLLDKELGVGNYKIAWDGKNSQGGDISSGVYFYRLQVMNKQSAVFVDTRKMLLIR